MAGTCFCTLGAVKATVEPLEGNKVRLRVTIEQEEIERKLDDAVQRIAREVRFDGFRPGRVPRKIVEAKLGKAAIRREALRDAVADFYERAVTEQSVDVIAPPQIEITEGEEEGPVLFDAVVEVRPKVSVAGYDSLRVTVPSPTVTDDEVDSQIDRIRQRFASFQAVDRPARKGDHVLVNITAEADGRRLENLSADEYLHEISDDGAIPELDARLTGARPGEVLEFDAELPSGMDRQRGEEDADDASGPRTAKVHFRVLVKEVQEKVLPDLDDSWVSDVSEFATVDELREDVRRRLEAVKAANALQATRRNAAEAVAALVTDELPQTLVEQVMHEQLHELADRLGSRGVRLDQYLAATGTSPEQLRDQLRSTAESAVRLDLALRAVAEAEGITVDEEELRQAVVSAAEAAGEHPDEVLERLRAAGRLEAIRIDLLKRRALDWVVEHAEVVDENGEAVDRARLEEIVESLADGERVREETADTAASETHEGQDAETTEESQ